MRSGTFGGVTHTGRIKIYPDGSREIMACSKPIFRAAGWEERGKKPGKRKACRDDVQGEGSGDPQRAVRRARSRVRDIALCNPMRFFVTLTLDQMQVDRYSPEAATRKLNAWLSNQVQRKGLKYVLVPELHKDGAIHFHGFFNDALAAVDSGTVIPPGGGKPKRPRSKKQRAEWLENGGHVAYNLPGWTLGFTTAIELYGDYDNAVGYVCKYIGKDMNNHSLNNSPDGLEPSGKIGGRWYYSGGDLKSPDVVYAPLDWRELAERPGAYVIEIPEAGAVFVKLREKGGMEDGWSTGRVLELRASESMPGMAL